MSRALHPPLNGLAAGLLTAILSAACQPELPTPGAPVTSREWVEASARVHDPAGLWSRFAAEVDVSSVDERGRLAFSEDLYIDRGADTFRRAIASREALLTQTVGPAGCTARWPGAVLPTDSDLARNGLTGDACAVILPRRDMHEFLIGLPMSALTPATGFGESPQTVEAFGQPAVRVDLTFADDPGGQAWYLYFDPATEVLIGAGFSDGIGRGERFAYGEYRRFEGFRLAQQRVVYDASGADFLIEQRLRFEAVGD